MNFDDDEETWREIQAAKEASILQAKLDEDLRRQREAAKMAQSPVQEQFNDLDLNFDSAPATSTNP